MKFSAVLALGLAQIVPAFAGYVCMMPNQQANPATSICTAAGGTPNSGSPTACCISESQKNSYERGCKDNGGTRIQYTYLC
ncbi:hypothetical protein CSOJ01_15474 [Colletotrichum sojae]|uniref:Uncharacterized protein n=1 Tax=Colletotrichum sojae TaxID=2175907 RepID=A0A8H6MI29_9PEZI|nr:hypothetical protein CSOJ01_15474 [Colletotrichum sojae]